MTISDRIFEKIRQLDMTQKEFAEETGIKQSTISEWKKNGTNPTSDKIMVICKVLNVTPEWLLSGVDKAGRRGSVQDYIVIDKDSDLGMVLELYKSMDSDTRNRIFGYMEALSSMRMKNEQVTTTS